MFKRIMIGIFIVILVALVFVVSYVMIMSSLPEKFTTAKIEIDKLVSAVDKYYTNYNQYPKELETLDENSLNFTDPWGNPYVYIIPLFNNLEYGIISIGPDKVIDTEDDIRSWELKD